MGDGKKLYHANKEVYGLLRYGVKVRQGQDENTKTVGLIDWNDPLNNDFAIAEEVSVKGQNTKRPDIVLYVNGIALGVIELKRSSVSVSEGIRQNLDNQKKTFIRDFYSTMQLLVVDKLLTGFDAPSATYLYIDKKMQDHGLFQAICRVNRLDGEDKEYGYIVDYKDLFHSLETSIGDYTSGAFDAYDEEDVHGLLSNRLKTSREKLEEARETVKALCEPVLQPRALIDYLRYFCGDVANADDLILNEAKRVALYKEAAALMRAYAVIANELEAAG